MDAEFGSRGRRLLVVDDEVNMQRMFQKVLSRDSLEVDAAGSVEEALNQIRKTNYDLLLIDVRLTPFTGLDLLEKIRQQDWSIPAIMITGYPSIYTARRSKELGAIDYITKPIDIEELHRVIGRALSTITT